MRAIAEKENKFKESYQNVYDNLRNVFLNYV